VPRAHGAIVATLLDEAAAWALIAHAGRLGSTRDIDVKSHQPAELAALLNAERMIAQAELRAADGVDSSMFGPGAPQACLRERGLLLAAMLTAGGCAATPGGDTPEKVQREIRLGMQEARFLQAFPDAKAAASGDGATSYRVALPRGCAFCAPVGGYLHLRNAPEATFEFERGRLIRAVAPDGQRLPLKPRLGAYAGQLQTRGRPYTWW
jgi:hypothetical protein